MLIIDSDLRTEDLERVRQEIFTNPVTQVSSLFPLDIDFHWCIWIGLRPGVKDNPGATAMEAIEDLLGSSFGPDEGIYASRRYCLTGETLTRPQVETLAKELLSNPIIQQFKIFSKADWHPEKGRMSNRPG